MTATTPESETLSLRDALAQMDKEARQGSFTTGRYTCAYTDWGEGPPLLFIHGLGDERSSHALVMAYLKHRFRCVAYDLPMGGRDQARLRKYTHTELVGDVFRLMDHLHIHAATLAGHSFGATIALRAMHDHPQRVTRGIVVCGFANRPLSQRQWWLALLARYFGGNRSLHILSGRDDQLKRAHHGPFAQHEPERWQHFLERTGLTPLRAMGHWGHQLHQLDLRPLLPGIKQPVLILCGDKDPLVPHAYPDYLFENLPNGLMFQIENCGHFPMLTHPETVADVLFKFVGMTSCPLHLLNKAKPQAAETCSGTADGDCQTLGCATERDGHVACEGAVAQG